MRSSNTTLRAVIRVVVVFAPLTAHTQTLPAGSSNPGPSSSSILVAYAPADIHTSGGCQSRITTFAVRSAAAPAADAKAQTQAPPNATLHGPILVAGSLEEKDTGRRLPVDAFELLERKTAAAKDAPPAGPANASQSSQPVQSVSCDDNQYKIITREDAIPASQLVTVALMLRDHWVKPGSYSGTLWIAAVEDSAAQPVQIKVYIRPECSWVWGCLAIAAGSLFSWWAVVYAARQRQLAGNQVLVSRLAELLNQLRETLDDVSTAGVPAATHTLAHIARIQQDRLQQLLTDRELNVLAGITVPGAGTITVVDEIEAVNRIVQNGFSKLLEAWNAQPGQQAALQPLFTAMDQLGATAQPLITIDQQITAILNQIPPRPGAIARQIAPQELQALPQESTVVQRVLSTTYWLDAVSLVVVIVLGVYTLIWKNPGFGSVGDLIEAFFWGLGLKLGTDAARLGATDVRTTLGIKIPSAG